MQRDQVLALLGGDRDDLRFTGCTRTEGPQGLWRLSFTTNRGGRVPALYLPPPGGKAAPAILYCHAHGGQYDIGMSELTDGRPALSAPFAPALAQAGFAVLCVEMLCFGARSDMAEGATAKACLWHGRTLFGQMLAEQGAGLDWLAAQPGVDGTRIGALGISMGGTLAWWLAALEPGIAAAAALSCFSDMGLLIGTGAHDRHGHYMTVPGLLRLGRTGQLAGLAAPKPLLFGIGLEDWGTPAPAFALARADVSKAYGDAGADDALSFHVEETLGHAESPAMRQAVMAFLDARLGKFPASDTP